MKATTAGLTSANESLRAELEGNARLRPRMRPGPPNWARQIARLGLGPEAKARLLDSLERLWLLPFSTLPAGTDLLIFQHSRLPARRAALVKENDARGLRLCVLFELLMSLTLQGSSVFPQNPLHLARLAQQAIESGLTDDDRLSPLLELLVDEQGNAVREGQNPFQLADANQVVLSEYERSLGVAEPAWKAPHKFEQHRQELSANPDFKADWELLKEAFPLDRFRDSAGILRRSPLPERYWQPPTFPDLRTTREQFQVSFDVFCWKWFLYAMRLDEPLPDKLTITFTPFGTQIFVPGYWSLDVARDLDWNRILKLHRARGVARQGVKLATGRKERSTQLARLIRAEAEAKAKGLKGADRYRFQKRAIGLAEATEDRQVRRLLADARKQAGTLRRPQVG